MPTVLVFLNESQIFQAERRTHQAGLGSSKPIRGNNPNENYKDAVKRTLYERYQDYDWAIPKSKKWRVWFCRQRVFLKVSPCNQHARESVFA